MLKATIVGVGTAIQRLDGMSRNVRAELAEEVKSQTAALLARAKEKVSGEVLKNRTGTLRRKLNMELDIDGARVIGTVGIKLSYAAAHEFGFEGDVLVGAHVRRNLRQMKEDQRSRINRGKRIFTDSRKQLGKGVIEVREHTRHMNLPERSFLRTALDERRGAIEAGIKAAVQRGASR